MRRIATVSALVVALALAYHAVHAQGRAPFNDTIRAADLRADLFFLAGDGFRGRLVGTPENALAAEFVRSRFERAGLQPGAPDGTFVQPTALMVATLGEGNRLEVASGDGPRLSFVSGQDFFPHRFSASGPCARRSPTRASASPRRRSATTTTATTCGPHRADPRSRARRAGSDSPFDGVVTAEPAVAIKKVLAAQDKGAVGVLFVTDVHNHPGTTDFDAAARSYWPDQPPRIDRFTLASWSDRVRIPVGQVSPALAEILVRGTGQPLEQLSRAAETASGYAGRALDGVEVTLTTAVDRHVVMDRNVLAMVEGADPALRDEAVIISAHYDHEGADGRTVFNGADDNGSGTVALLEIADAYGAALATGQRPRRTVIFACWGSEERGPLLGAWAYTEHPTRPLDRTVAVLNMDMVGRNEEVQAGAGPRFNGLEVQTAESNRNAVNILGYSRHPALSAVVERVNRESYRLDLRLRYDNNRSNLLRRSDQWPFLQHGVPALWFHTGLHPDYHTQYDRPEKINYEKMETIARLVHQASWDLATASAAPARGK
ncbi:MAG: M28 family peptidase [Vicinamibacterales bacterium]